MHITILQHDIEWCQVQHNLAHLDTLLSILPKTDLLLLPEMFATGLNNAAIDIVDEQPKILAWMQAKARELDAAVVGSIATEDAGHCYNRLHRLVLHRLGVLLYRQHSSLYYPPADRSSLRSVHPFFCRPQQPAHPRVCLGFCSVSSDFQYYQENIAL